MDCKLNSWILNSKDILILEKKEAHQGVKSGVSKVFGGGPHVVRWTSVGVAHSDQYKKYNINSNNMAYRYLLYLV